MSLKSTMGKEKRDDDDVEDETPMSFGCGKTRKKKLEENIYDEL